MLLLARIPKFSKASINGVLKFTSSKLVRSGEHDYPEVENLNVKWILKSGEIKVTPAAEGSNLMKIAHRHGIELEGACEGSCACSTCHVILEKKVYDNLPEPSEDEEDMLDQAFGLTATSRLGCQVYLTKEQNEMTIKIPKATRNFYVDGHVPKPH